MRHHTTQTRQRNGRVFRRLLVIAILASSLVQLALGTAPIGVEAQPGPELNWARLATTGPSDRRKPVMAYDPISERLILYVGVDNINHTGTTWAWDGSTWTELSPPTSPPGRNLASLAFDPIRGQLILYGGLRVNPATQQIQAMGDTWAWDGATWIELSPPTSPTICEPSTGLCFSGRYLAELEYDPVTGQLILFSGFHPRVYSDVMNDTWTWDGSTWTKLSPITSPRQRGQFAMAYNPVTSQLILFGGISHSPAGNGILGDTWEWDGATWHKLSPATSPDPRNQHEMAFDPTTGQLLLFGGFESWDGAQADTWVWDGTNWHELSPSSRPARRGRMVMAYDPATSQLILFGGLAAGNLPLPIPVYGDTWSWGFDTHQVLTVTLDFPDAPSGQFDWFNALDMPVIGSVTASDPLGVTDISCTDATVSSVVGYNTPTASGAVSAPTSDGIYRVTCEATNTEGATSSEGSYNTVFVRIDTTPPEILNTGIYTGFVSGTPGLNGWYVSPVTHDFRAIDYASRIHGCENVLSGNGVTFRLRADSGTEQGNAVTISSGACPDFAGNVNPGIESDPYKIDYTPPYDVTFTGGGVTDGASYHFGFVPDGPTDCAATDDVSGFDHCILDGYDTSVGTHTITATAYDVAGNSEEATLTYTVLAWTIEGFFPPVTNTEVNVVKAGRTVPLKFAVYAGATELTETSIVSEVAATPVVCEDATGGDPVPADATGDTGLRYDGQFIFNWKVPEEPGSCYLVRVTTEDGSSIAAQFKLR